MELEFRLRRFIGQTVTVFTESGGLSGSGFTGVLASVSPTSIKLINSIGFAPACPISKSCGHGHHHGHDCHGGHHHGKVCCDKGHDGRHGHHDCDRFDFRHDGFRRDDFFDDRRDFERTFFASNFSNMLGTVSEIPLNKIVNFTHNSI